MSKETPKNMYDTSSNFETMRKDFMEAIQTSVEKNDFAPILKKYNSIHESDVDKRAALDQGFRDIVLVLLGCDTSASIWQTFVTQCVQACRREMATVTTPVVLLGDVFECLTLVECEQLFVFVEDNVSIWKEDLFFTSCKNNLLRMCNDLLRRLSRYKNTVFCGRILLFLAKFFPFSERSGLNIVSEFNLDNVTQFSTEDSAVANEDSVLDDSLSEGDIDKLKIDNNIYCKFWSLQNFFRNPLLVYNKSQWDTFVKQTENVLSIFKSFKMDSIQNKKVKSGEPMITDSYDKDYYFAKFLTNKKLLDLQLSDIKFRRSILVQFLILFQYLNAPVKFKNEDQELKPLEAQWVQQTSDTVYSLLKETPPDGEGFTKAIQFILQREELWNNWKNDGCPELKRPISTINEGSDEEKWRNLSEQRRNRKRLGTILNEAQGQKKVFLSHVELSKLWSYMPDNLEACRAPERNFLMPLDEYFKEAIEQLDPAAMVEDHYKVVNDTNFGWRALRLIALQSTNFFSHNNAIISDLPTFLESMIKRIAKDRPIATGEAKPDSLEVTNEAETENLEEEEELLKSEEQKIPTTKTSGRSEATDNCKAPPGIAANILDSVARSINTKWKDIAGKIGLNDAVEYIESLTNTTDLEKARHVIQLWTENEPYLKAEGLLKALELHGYPQTASAAAHNN